MGSSLHSRNLKQRGCFEGSWKRVLQLLQKWKGSCGWCSLWARLSLFYLVFNRMSMASPEELAKLNWTCIQELLTPTANPAMFPQAAMGSKAGPPACQRKTAAEKPFRAFLSDNHTQLRNTICFKFLYIATSGINWGAANMPPWTSSARPAPCARLPGYHGKFCLAHAQHSTYTVIEYLLHLMHCMPTICIAYHTYCLPTVYMELF